ncbi:uncharacterized protein LOC131231035 [Magnolia sinica]|uniref:uncharacterized protein LOC131231035 n=1 Tax=Magnolia sinica TaxID=86752 RepID=UPI00265B43D7|nr:uncharacterized protein LOC131231035 [Magnolia sinica]
MQELSTSTPSDLFSRKSQNDYHFSLFSTFPSMADSRNSFRTCGGGERKPEMPNDSAFGQAYQKSTRSPDPPSEWCSSRPRTIYHMPSTSMSPSSLAINDRELQRRKRVAGYKSYALGGQVKSSFRKGFRWVKNICSNFVRGH